MQEDDFSRFRTTEMTILDGKETFGRWKPPSFLVERPAEENISVFRVNSSFEGRPDLISDQVYGTPLLDWVIIAFNNVRDPMNWPQSGSVIEYPSDTIVLPELL